MKNFFGHRKVRDRGLANVVIGALEVRDERFVRVVAMKVISVLTPATRRSSGSCWRRRWLARAPNIVPVRDLGTHVWGQPFYTMKLVQEVTLHEVLGGLREGRLAKN